MIPIEFGERVHHRKKPSTGPLAKLEVLWQDGVYLGQRAAIGECIVGFGSGVETTRNMHRKPEGERWTLESERLVQGVPWRTSPEDPDQDGLVDVLPPNADLGQESALTTESVPRRLYLRKEGRSCYRIRVHCEVPWLSCVTSTTPSTEPFRGMPKSDGEGIDRQSKK